MGKVDISIIIINYKTIDLVSQCVDSVKEKSHGFSYEIIIVDNSCDSYEFKKLESLFKLDDRVQVVTPNKNLGTSAGNNYGAKYAKGDYLLLLNSDTLLINNAFLEMLTFARRKQNPIVGANLFTKDLKPAHSYIKDDYNLKTIKRISSVLSFIKKVFTRKRTDFNYSEHPVEISGYICSAVLLIPRELYEDIGGSDERLFMYADDPMLCFAAKKEGGAKIFNVPSAKVIHLEGASDKQEYSDFKIKDFIFGIYTYLTIAYGKKEGEGYLKYAVKNFRMKSRLWRLANKTKSVNDYRLSLEAKRVLERRI